MSLARTRGGATWSGDTKRVRGFCPACHREAFWIVDGEFEFERLWVCWYEVTTDRRTKEAITMTHREWLSSQPDTLQLTCSHHGVDSDVRIVVDRAALERLAVRARRLGRSLLWRASK